MQPSDQTRNRLKVLKAIRHAGPVARSQLPSLTGLAGGTITYLASDLVARGLVVEDRQEAPQRGRPRSYLSINTAGALVIGVSIGPHGTLSAAFVDLAGNLLEAREVPIGHAASLADYAVRIAEAVDDAIGGSRFARSAVSRIGIALPGIVDMRRGIVHFVTTFPPGPAAFADPIAQRLGLPVRIENDMACMARAEHWFGRAQHLDTFTVIDFGFSLGSARYVGGLPMTGANGISAEMGHQKIERGPSARPCFCGGRGCVTAYASIYGMLDAAGALEGLPFPPVRRLDRLFAALIDRAADGEAQARDMIALAGDRLGMAVANHLNAADPGDILIRLPDPRLQALIAEPFEDALVACVMPGMLASTRVTFVPADATWRWKGSAALALEQAYLETPLSMAT